jgi:hypothetical protein
MSAQVVADTDRHLWLDELVAAGLVPAATVAAGGVSVTDTSRSNPSFIVSIDGQASLFVKSQTASVYGDARSTLAHEAAVQRMVCNNPAISALAPRALRLLRAGLLVSEAIAPAVGYGDVVVAGRAEHGAMQLGAAVGALHAATSDWGLPRRTPWVADARQGWQLGVRHQAIDRLNALVNADPTLDAAVAAVGDTWHARCVVHGDLKWDNVLVRASGQVVLVDWELATTGDPRWDIAAVCAAHLAAGRLDGRYLDPGAMSVLLGRVESAYEAATGTPWDHPELRPWIAARLVEHAVLLAVTRPHHAGAPEQLIGLARSLADGSEPW